MKKNYQMTTVYKYAQLLDEELTQNEKSIKKAVDKYLYKARRANADANLLEQLLA